MNNEYFKPCTKCGRPQTYCKGTCCKQPKGCECPEYGPKVCGAIRPGQPECPAQAVIPSLTVESVSNLKDLADCFVHVADINTTFYIDDKHRIMTTWAGLVSVDDYDFEANPLNLRGQIAYDAKNNKAAIFDKQGASYIFQISDIDNNYLLLENKPQINGVELSGDRALVELDIAATFDTVADMKAATDLKNGSVVKTLGFYSLNDGGGATYKISSTGTANEMDVIAVGSLYANLVYGDKVNVKQLGAYGDNSHDDSAVFSRGADIARNNSIPLHAPKHVYKISSQITLKHIVIDFEGTINNTQAIILGANSTASTVTHVKIFQCGDVQVEGAKVSYFNIRKCGALTLYANGNDSLNTSLAYNKFEGIEVNSITINGVNNGWINENEFNIKRCLGDLTITGDGTYIHNNNHFNNICIEGSNKHITINYGHNNYITYRGENSPVVTVNDNPLKAFANVVNKQYSVNYPGTITAADMLANKTMNYIGQEYFPTTQVTDLMDINPYSVKTLNSGLYVDNNGKVVGSWANEYLCDNLPADKPFVITIYCPQKSQRIYITCYDSGGNPTDGYVAGPGITQNTSNKEYRTAANTDYVVATFAPSASVHHLKVLIMTGGSAPAFDYAIAKLYTPFTNTTPFHNEIDTTRKTMSSSPAGATSLNQTWGVGDIVYNSAPTAGGNIGWVCTAAGTPGTWKTFGSIEA